MRQLFHLSLLKRITTLWVFILLTVPAAVGRNKVQPGTGPTIHYRLEVAAGDTSRYKVEMKLTQVAKHFRLAMATHHEYDDRFWRFVRNFRVETVGGKAIFQKSDSAVWDITIPGRDAVVSYTIQLPVGHRFAHQPFLSSRGGLLGDIHSFFYLVGETQIPASVTFELPAGWQIVTGLEKTIDPNTFRAASAKILMDCPVLAGYLHQWSFIVKGIPHTVAYLSVSDNLRFDTIQLVDNLKKIATQAIGLFGGAPYSHFAFLLQDGVVGALEHVNSVTIGAPGALLANHMQEVNGEIAHEFIHSWNEVNIRPSGYTDLNFGAQEQSAALWFTEGLTMFYADLLQRRAGLPLEDSTRVAHLQSLIGRYYADSGNMALAPAAVSLAANAGPGMLGDYSASVHVQGELIGSMLDLLIKNTTKGARSFDDVMRLMYQRFGGKRGFDARDVEEAVRAACPSPEVHSFFQKYVYRANPLDFNSYLRLIGLHVSLSYRPSIGDSGRPAPDQRLYIWQPAGDTIFRFVMTSPASCWVKAGLHTGDALLAIDNQSIKNRQTYNDHLKTIKIGDKLTVQIDRHGHNQMIPVDITGYQIPIVQLLSTEDKNIEAQQLFRQWAAGR
jgi:predicted metalloprotease with PDZ domain